MIKWGKCVEYNKPVVKELPDTISPPLSLPTSGLFVTVQVHTPGTRKKKIHCLPFSSPTDSIISASFSLSIIWFVLSYTILGWKHNFYFIFLFFVRLFLLLSFHFFIIFTFFVSIWRVFFLSLQIGFCFFYYFVFQPVKKKLFGSSSSSSVLFICLVSFYFYYVVCVSVCVCILLRFLCVSIRNGSIRLIEGNGRSWSPSWTLRER